MQVNERNKRRLTCSQSFSASRCNLDLIATLHLTPEGQSVVLAAEKPEQVDASLVAAWHSVAAVFVDCSVVVDLVVVEARIVCVEYW